MKTSAVGPTIVVLLSVALSADPGSVADALAKLRNSQAGADDWSGFKPGSSVTYRQIYKGASGGTSTEITSLTLTARNANGLDLELTLSGGQRLPYFPQPADLPELAASTAEKIGEEELAVGAKFVRTDVYRFSYIKNGHDSEQIFWLAPGVPDGVVRHRVTIVFETWTSRTESNLTDVNVRMKAGTKSVKGYCFETVDGLRGGGGKVKLARICKSREVPGAVVTGETRELDGNVETASVIQSVESFNAVR